MRKIATAPTATKVKTSIAMPRPLWRQLRMRALEENRSVFSILEELAASYVARPLKKGGR